MRDDELISRIRERARALGQPVAACADASTLDAAEQAIGFALPSFYRRLLLEVGNGGLGPGAAPLNGMPPDGYFDSDLGGDGLVARYLADRRSSDWPAPRGVLFLCSWGCGKWSHLDCETDDGAVLTSEWCAADDDRDEGIVYWRTSPSLRAFMCDWLERDADAPADLTVRVVGRETRKNPFTGLPREYPIVEPRGEIVDLSERAQRS
jgi:hypothetical protein